MPASLILSAKISLLAVSFQFVICLFLFDRNYSHESFHIVPQKRIGYDVLFACTVSLAQNTYLEKGDNIFSFDLHYWFGFQIIVIVYGLN